MIIILFIINNGIEYNLKRKFNENNILFNYCDGLYIFELHRNIIIIINGMINKMDYFY